MNRRQALLILSFGFVGACSRGVTVGSSTPGSTYEVYVTNSTGTAMDVYYNDGSEHALGSVPSGGSPMRFIVPARKATVTIGGRAQNGTRTSGPYEVNLSSGTTRLTLK